MNNLSCSDTKMRRDVAALLQRCGPVKAWSAITALPNAQNTRVCYRVELADGRLVKARGFANDFEASRFLRSRNCITDTALNAIIERDLRAILEAWVLGESGENITWTTDLYYQAGEILGRIHNSAPPATDSAMDDSGESCLAEIHNNLAYLTKLNILDAEQAHLITAVLKKIDKNAIDIGIIHGDFCAENFVLTPEQQLVVIDNETMRVSALDYDLGRSLWRWPVELKAAKAFRQGYTHYRSFTLFQRHFAAWLSAALLASIRYRQSHSPMKSEAPLRMLRSLIQRLKEDPNLTWEKYFDA